MPCITTTSGKRFEAVAGESLLDAGLRCGVALGYSCRTGRCSSCKGRVQAGKTAALHEELGLTPSEREAGWILACVRTAVSDVEIEVEDLGDIVLPAARTLPCRIQSMERLAPDVMRVLLRLPPSSSFNYLAGQYIDVIGPRGVRRSYSIANAPREDKLIELHIREVADGVMSNYWFEQAEANDLLRLHGPLGTFLLRNNMDGQDLVFLATGTGIAPVKAMLEALAQRAELFRPRSMAVYWGGRKPQDLYWTPSVDTIPLSFIPVLSRAEPDWTGARGHVQDAMLADAPVLARTRVFACGSDTMIHSARERLVAEGLLAKNFHSDAFVCSSST